MSSFIPRWAQDTNTQNDMLCSEYGVSKEENDKRIKAKKERMAKNKERYTQGVYIDAIPTQYGDMIKVSINREQFCANNTVTNGGYISFFIKKSKGDGYYAENVSYSRNK